MSAKYTYENWLAGKFSIEGATSIYHLFVQKDFPDSIKLESVPLEDRTRIQEEQKALFEEAVEKQVQIFETNFSTKFANSRMPEQLLSDEIAQINRMLFGELQDDGDMFYTTHWRQSMEKDYIFRIQDYARDCIKNDAIKDFSIMHSPNFAYQDKKVVPPQILDTPLWQYWEIISKYDEREMTEEEDEKHLEADHQFVSNPYPHIFKNDASYAFFIDLKNHTVDEKTRVADYSYIYHKLIHDDLGAIWNTIKQSEFCTFLTTKMEVDQIRENKLPYNDAERKRPIYSLLLKKYDDLIRK